MLDTPSGPHPEDVYRASHAMEDPAGPPEAHVPVSDLVPLRSALKAGEILVHGKANKRGSGAGYD
ncbi:hypothetical protein BKA62DRAFT_692229 [Auriculariales sp. MPI-PUGE-AT-0066]|nr:hypothetical protein BKA62DRAFT_692229 [Auriculariales sp. MPI-PUGE-AT-0066]